MSWITMEARPSAIAVRRNQSVMRVSEWVLVRRSAADGETDPRRCAQNRGLRAQYRRASGQIPGNSAGNKQAHVQVGGHTDECLEPDTPAATAGSTASPAARP